jgi:hypothetical protein
MAGIGVRDPPEWVITSRRNPCSGSSGTAVHDRSESAFRMLRNTHPTTDALDLRVRVPGWTGWIDEGNGWRRRHKGATVPSMVDGHGAPLVDMWALGTQYRVTWP